MSSLRQSGLVGLQQKNSTLWMKKSAYENFPWPMVITTPIETRETRQLLTHEDCKHNDNTHKT